MRFCLLLVAASLLAQNYKVNTDSGVIGIDPESYVAGVVTGEAGELKSDEALKAMAVAARSYAARLRGRHSNEGFDFCSTTHCQRYVSASNRGTRAARETVQQMLWYQHQPAYAVYSQSCGGKTEAVSAVWPDIQAPYLNSHLDPYCSFYWKWLGSKEDIAHALAQSGIQGGLPFSSISIVRQTNSGRAKLLSLDRHLISASTFRFAVGRALGWNTIRSDMYSIENVGSRILFRGAGAGHGVGLCQLGADQMALQGKTFKELLAFYYPGTTLDVHATDFHWTRLSGEGVVLFTLKPDSDRKLISIAEAIINRWRGQLPWEIPGSIEIYVYQDLDGFRNATGEPGWVAARTIGRKIELQPTAILEAHQALQTTLDHEVLHCFIESSARSDLPVWFREGLVESLAGGASKAANGAPEENLRQRTDRVAAQHGYENAQARVQSLIKRYGKPAVLSWVTRGLPADVKYSTASNPPVKSR